MKPFITFLVAFFSLGIFWASASLADCVPRTTQQSFTKSDQVVLARTVRLEEGEYSENRVGLIATLEVLKHYKGSKSSQVSVNCSYNKLMANYVYCPSNVGEAYILFLNEATASVCEPNMVIPVRDRLTRERYEILGIPQDFEKEYWPDEAAAVERAKARDLELDRLAGK